ncbi:MFS transporter [Mobilicoccus massiliensis]|uniref:MFS transporter n=1 Tax=Mobilicoccus massiliensis TaxID=1522310 RepID=UPI000A3EAF10|nr:MFS transporter [Mobilicoccus massiliensis]
MRTWIVWVVGVLAYASAVLQRTSFGVAGVDAAERFGAPAGVVATFVVLQLVVYAAMQIPVGVLLDRFGSRLLITTGALVMAMGQVVMASAGSAPEGMIARVLVGAGDAMTFASVIRLVPAWFAPRRVPIVTQMTGLLGQSGQIASAVPFAYALHSFGWSPSFLGSAAVAIVVLVLALALIRNAPAGVAPAVTAMAPGEIGRLLAETWRTPGTRLGIWTHYVTCFTPMTFAMMWGVPFLVLGEGRTAAEASGLLALHVVASLPCGPLLGSLTQRYPVRRSNLVLAVVAANAVPWIAVLCWPGPAPMWLLAILALGLATGGPGSAIGFDFARTFNPSHRLGTATGLVIMGGFGGALVAILLIGILVDLAEGAGLSSHLAFRLAMGVQVPMLAAGVVGLLSARRATRASVDLRVDPMHRALRRRFARRDEGRP